MNGYKITLVDGRSGNSYKNIDVTGDCIPDDNFVIVDANGIQNGGSDGIALYDSTGSLVEFISYEGVVTYNGVTSVDVGVAESSSTPVGYSLQKVGDGCKGDDFTWKSPSPSSRGTVNSGQSISCAKPCDDVEVSVTTDDYPEETSWSLTNKSSGEVVATSGSFTKSSFTYKTDLCLDLSDCYTFKIVDSYGDGLTSPNGDFSLTVAGTVLLQDNDEKWSMLETQFGNCSPTCLNVDVSVTTDDYPEETSWSLTTTSGVTIATGGPYDKSSKTYDTNECVDPSKCYNFEIVDSYGDGLTSPNGDFTLTVDGSVLLQDNDSSWSKLDAQFGTC